MALDVHGIHADRIVVATRFETLSPEAREALLGVKSSRNIALHFLAEDLGFEEPGCAAAQRAPSFRTNSALKFRLLNSPCSRRGPIGG